MINIKEFMVMKYQENISFAEIAMREAFSNSPLKFDERVAILDKSFETIMQNEYKLNLVERYIVVEDPNKTSRPNSEQELEKSQQVSPPYSGNKE